jgi:hypothetical protein
LLLFFTRVRGQMIFGFCVAVVVLFYPVLRSAGYIPVDTVYEFTKERSEDRAQSLKFRLDNEDILLERANEKPVSGWGGWGRSRVYDKEESKELSVADGAWIIIIGQSGWLGYIVQFGLLTLPLLLLGFGSKHKLRLPLATSGLVVVLSINLIDLIPNGTLTPVTFLLSGALFGRYEHARATPRKLKTATVKKPQVRHHRRARGQPLNEK